MGYVASPMPELPKAKCPSCNLLYVEDLEDCCVVCGYHALRGIWVQGCGSGYGVHMIGDAVSVEVEDVYDLSGNHVRLPVPSAGQSTSK